nr:hypothetical protein [Labilibaculum manganireducens]
MRNIYYLIWSDAILSFKKYHPKREDWKMAIFFFNTWINALNLWILFIWLKYFNLLNVPLIRVELFPGDMLDKFVSFSLVFAFPFGLLNYFLIFYKDRYKLILIKYPKPPKKCAFIYSTGIALGAFVTAILYGILT